MNPLQYNTQDYKTTVCKMIHTHYQLNEKATRRMVKARNLYSEDTGSSLFYPMQPPF